MDLAPLLATIFGGAVGGAGQAVADQRTEQLKRDTLAQQNAYNFAHLGLLGQQLEQQQKQFEAKQAADEASKFTLMPSEFLPMSIRGQYPTEPTSGMVKVPTASLGTFEKAREADITREGVSNLQGMLSRGQGAPWLPQPTQSELFGALANVPHGAELAKVMFPTDAWSIHGGEKGQPLFRINRLTGESQEISPGYEPPDPNRNKTMDVEANGRKYLVTMDQVTGREVSRQDMGPVVKEHNPTGYELAAQYAMEYRNLLDTGQGDSPRARQLRSALGAFKMITAAPGGNVFSLDDMLFGNAPAAGGGGAPPSQTPAQQPGAPPATTGAPQPRASVPAMPTEPERQAQAGQLSTLDALKHIRDIFNPDWVGPFRNRAAGVFSMIPGSQNFGAPGTSPEESAFDKELEQLQTTANREIARRFGPQEFAIVKATLPSKAQQPNQFLSAIDVTERRLRDLLTREAEQRAAAGVRTLPGPAPATPAGAGPKTPSPGPGYVAITNGRQWGWALPSDSLPAGWQFRR